jgi:hypothetical protein
MGGEILNNVKYELLVIKLKLVAPVNEQYNPANMKNYHHIHINTTIFNAVMKGVLNSS